MEKIDKFGWWYLERISVDASTQFYPMDFKDECKTCGVWLTSAAPEHQQMKGQVKVIRRMLRTIANSVMVHARVLEAYIHFTLMCTADHIFPVLTIKNLINEADNSTTLFRLMTGTKPSISHLHVLFCPCVVQNSTARIGTKSLNMRLQEQNCFRCIFVGITHHQKGYFVYVPQKRNIVSLNNAVFDDS